MSDRTTRFFFYCSVLLVAVSSVLFGLDWLPARMPPMAPSKVVANAPPPAPPAKVVRPNAALSPLAPANPVSTSPVTQQPVAPAAVAPPPPLAAAPVAANPPVAQTLPKPTCDVDACAAAYRSFRESDCTYNPSFGPRRLCSKGVLPSAAAPDAPPPIANPEPDADPQSNARCNVSACAAAYRSFRESDCTYNPSFGPRRICAK